jgi:hypothetical protein
MLCQLMSCRPCSQEASKEIHWSQVWRLKPSNKYLLPTSSSNSKALHLMQDHLLHTSQEQTLNSRREKTNMAVKHRRYSTSNTTLWLGGTTMTTARTSDWRHCLMSRPSGSSSKASLNHKLQFLWTHLSFLSLLVLASRFNRMAVQCIRFHSTRKALQAQRLMLVSSAKEVEVQVDQVSDY